MLRQPRTACGAATALLSAGGRLHSGIATTAKHSAHVERGLRRDAADSWDPALGLVTGAIIGLPRVAMTGQACARQPE